ncbi:MAG TPA: hypothetical protein VNH18_32650 [Bryobacteraceae bacterium]|nr:hypothetical protein [Bryobacteraceae bacterium]
MSFDAALFEDAKLLDAVTTGTGTGIQLNGGKLLKVFFQAGGTTISAGAVQIEEAYASDYSGTWSPIGSPQTISTTSTNVLIFEGPFKAIRARVSTTVTGTGTPSVTVWAVVQ